MIKKTRIRRLASLVLAAVVTIGGVTEMLSDPVFASEKDSVIEDFTPVKAVMAKDTAIAGKTGVAIPAGALTDAARMELVTKHFNSVTCENEMKPDAFLGWVPEFKKDSTGNEITTADGDKLIQLHFSAADTIMDYMKNWNENHPADKIQVRGHVLVWHSQTPDWFFRENYDTNQAYVSREKMLVRMENYIKDVMEHFDGADSPYRGMIYAWDVVNEQIEPWEYNQETNPDSLRVTCGGAETAWHQIFQGDNSYITQAFVLANKYAPEHIKLYYNDYGDVDDAKSKAISNLLAAVKNTPGARIDGMGMQAHYSMEYPSTDLIETAVRRYASVVSEVQITELDIASSQDYDGTNRQEELKKEGYRYQEIFDTLCRLDHEDGIDITALTVWGTDDGHSWLTSSSSVGGGQDGTRPQLPLLFDENYKVKPAYWGIVDPDGIEHPKVPGAQNPGKGEGDQNPGENAGDQNPGENPGDQNPGGTEIQNPGSADNTNSVEKTDLQNCEILVEDNSPIIYSGTARTPALQISYGGRILQSGTDYTAVYQNNINAGEAQIVLTGQGEFQGTVIRTFTIQKAEQEILCTPNYSKVYGGKSFVIKPELVRGDGAMQFASSNKKVAAVDDTGRVKMKGCGAAVITVKAAATANFKEKTADITVKVSPKKISSLSVKRAAKGSKLTVKWKKDAKADGYQIQYSTSARFKKDVKSTLVKKNSMNVKTVGKIKAQKEYYVRVRAYKTVVLNGKKQKLYGAWSSVKSR